MKKIFHFWVPLCETHYNCLFIVIFPLIGMEMNLRLVKLVAFQSWPNKIQFCSIILSDYTYPFVLFSQNCGILQIVNRQRSLNLI